MLCLTQTQQTAIQMRQKACEIAASAVAGGCMPSARPDAPIRLDHASRLFSEPNMSSYEILTAALTLLLVVIGIITLVLMSFQAGRGK